MLMIRFQRIGRTNDAAFRIVVIDKERAAKAGAIVEQVGTYSPHSKAMTLDAESVKLWVSKGAQLSDSVKNLLIEKKVMEGTKANSLPRRPSSAKAPEGTAPAEVAAVTEQHEATPVAEPSEAAAA